MSVESFVPSAVPATTRCHDCGAKLQATSTYAGRVPAHRVCVSCCENHFFKEVASPISALVRIGCQRLSPAQRGEFLNELDAFIGHFHAAIRQGRHGVQDDLNLPAARASEREPVSAALEMCNER